MNKSLAGLIRVTDKLYISIFSVFALLFIIQGQGLVYSSVFISSAAIHEASHLFFLLRYRAEIQRITVFPFGIDIATETLHLSYKKEIICTLAGSFANIASAFLGCILLKLFPSPVLLFFILCNLFLGFMNLIPLSFFDGGKAIRLFIYDRLDIDKAFYVCKSIDVISAFIFLGFSLFVISGSDFNLSVICVMIYASISTLALYKKQTI